VCFVLRKTSSELERAILITLYLVGALKMEFIKALLVSFHFVYLLAYIFFLSSPHTY
jgi:hypothetical protein